MRVKRRDFLKSLTALGAASLVYSPTIKAFSKAPGMAEAGLSGVWLPSTCQGCTTWCAIQVYVQDGRAVKVRGNSNSMVNPGYVCPRGHLIPKMMYDPDRIKVPMKRTNPAKGKGVDPQFVPISWDEATGLIADKIMELRQNEEPHKLAIFRGRYTGLNNILYSHFPKIIGSPNNISHSSICAEAEKAGSYFTEGFWGYRDYDTDRMKYFVLWGVDPVRSNRMVPSMISKFGEMLDRMKIVTIDPILTGSAAKSHEWLPVKPGEDGALATAMAHVILTDGKWSKDFVGDFHDGINLFKAGMIVDESAFNETHTNGIVKWWNIELHSRTPEWAEVITGIPASKIRQIANELADQAPYVGVWLGPGPVMNPRGTYAAMAIHALNGLLGSADHEGGTLRQPKISLASQPSITPYQDQIAIDGTKLSKIDQRGTLLFPTIAGGNPGSGVVCNNVANAILEDSPYELKMAIGYWCNFNFSGMQGQRWDDALTKLPFFVHITTHPAEMTQFADVVLPAAFHATERWGHVISKGNLHSNLSIQQPMARRLFDVKTDETEIVWLIAEKLRDRGFSNLYDYLHNEFADPETGILPESAEQFDLFATKRDTKPQYDTIGGWAEFVDKGVVNKGPYIFGTLVDNFGTETKKFEFYSETLKKGLTTHATKHNTTIDAVLEACNYEARGESAFVPHYESPRRWGSKAEYPFDFIDVKSRLNREGRSQNTHWYYEFKKVDPGDSNFEDVVKINPIDAKALSITDGMNVRITSVTGTAVAKVKLWEGIQPGTISKTFGQGHWAYGRLASGDYSQKMERGFNNNDILPDDYDRITGSSARNGGFTGVKIERI